MPAPKKILLTGGSGGIGTAIRKALNSEFYRIYNLDQVRPEHSSAEEHFMEVDLSNPDEVEKVLLGLENISEFYGFIHCAGYGGPFHAITEVGMAEWRQILDINLTSAYQISRFFLEKTGAMKRYIFIASSLSIVGAKNSVAYSASKHALVGFAKSLADEWGESGTTFNCISPGYVETKMGIQETEVSDHRKKILEMTPSRKIADPSEIARVVQFILSEDSNYINGANWAVDGGITAV